MGGKLGRGNEKIKRHLSLKKFGNIKNGWEEIEWDDRKRVNDAGGY